VNEWSVTKAPWPSGYFFSSPDKLNVLRLSIYLDVYTNRSICTYTVVLRPFGVSKGLRVLFFFNGPNHFFLKKNSAILERMQATSILSWVIAVDLATFRLLTLQNTPPITTTDLLQAIGGWDGKILTSSSVLTWHPLNSPPSFLFPLSSFVHFQKLEFVYK
jgi:hypothetical protein